MRRAFPYPVAVTFPVCVFFVAALSLHAATKPKLAEPYRQFVSGPTSLLLTRDERQAFEKLTEDAQRDSFIEHFWEVRNPTAGLASNEFKEEFYRRVAYADSFYGKDSGSQGWRTDRGRTYILFGKPQTSMNYNGNQELYATELWFYANPGLAELPSFFYVIFYEGDGVSGYHVYNPYTDGPDKLLHEGGNSKATAYRYLHGISAELANATLSYIPGEPLDTDTYSGSMSSTQIVNAIHGFNEMPSYIRKIRMRSLRLEHVTSKVEYKLQAAQLSVFVVMEQGRPWAHWRMEVNDPSERKWADATARFEVHSQLFSQGRLVLEQTDKPEFAVPAASAEAMSKRPILYEDRLPVEAGRFQLTAELKNQQTGAVYEASQEFEVKPPAADFSLSDVLIIEKHAPARRAAAYVFSGVEFLPSAQNYVVASRGLNILYQVHLPAERPASLVAHYAAGQISTEIKKTFDEKLDLQNADKSGNLLIAKQLPIQELGPGSYRLSIRLEDPASKKISAVAVSFTVISEIPTSTPLVIARSQSETPQSRAAIAYERALCLLSQNRPSEAAADLRASWELSNNSSVKILLDQLQTTLGSPRKN